MIPEYSVPPEFRHEASKLNARLLKLVAQENPFWWMQDKVHSKSFRKWSLELMKDRDIFELYIQHCRTER